MAACRALAYVPRHSRQNDSSCLYVGEERALPMPTKYALLRLKTPKPGGGFWEAFRLGLVELGSNGDEFYDQSGYPFPDEVHAFVHDWLNLSGDFQEAMRKVDAHHAEHNWIGHAHGQGEGTSSAAEKSRK